MQSPSFLCYYIRLKRCFQIISLKMSATFRTLSGGEAHSDSCTNNRVHAVLLSFRGVKKHSMLVASNLDGLAGHLRGNHYCQRNSCCKSKHTFFLIQTFYLKLFDFVISQLLAIRIFLFPRHHRPIKHVDVLANHQKYLSN